MEPAWYEYPKLLRKRAPKAILVGTHDYLPIFFGSNGPFVDESNSVDRMPYILKKAFEYLDYFMVCDKPSWDYMKEKLNIPVLYAHITEPQLWETPPPTPISWEKRNGIFTINHSNFLPINRKISIIKDTNLSATIISTNRVERDAENLKLMALAFKTKVNCLDALPFNDYIKFVNTQRVAFDIDYIGICRMAYEGAMLGVPTVGTKLMEYRTMLYPELTVKTPEEMVEKILSIYNDEAKTKGLNAYAGTIIREYLSEKAVHERTVKLMSKMGVDV
jgi:hypothetical protein